VSISGIHRSLDFTTYTNLPFVNSGAITWAIDSSLAHMRDAIDGLLEREDTTDKKFGRGTHCRVLEGAESFRTRFLVATKCVSQFGNGKPCTAPGIWHDGKAWYCGRHKTEDSTQPEDYVSVEESVRIEAMADALHKHESLAMLKRHGWSEVTVIGERCGVMCKGRIDRMPEEMDILIDIKKCGVGQASNRKCEASIASYGWHRQAAIYVDLVRQFHPTNAEPRFAWVFIEDKPPHRSNIIVASDTTLDCGRWEVDQVLTEWKRAQSYGRYPDYMPDPRRPYVGGLPNTYIVNWNKRKQAIEERAG
jgi:hypothetical protein